MNATTLQQALVSRLQGIARTCLRLILEPGTGTEDEPTSTVGGQPWLPAGEPWPRCDGCGQPLTFVGQLRLDGGGHWRPGNYDLLSVFSCWVCNSQENATTIERPSGENCHLRLLRLAEQPLAPIHMPVDSLLQHKLLPCHVRGEPRLDVPGWGDVADEFVRSAPHALEELHACYQQAQSEVLRRDFSAPESQLGGYPHWLGESAWPECRWCGGQMYLLAQLASEKTARLDWGQARSAYVFCCAGPCDPHALTLVLQSSERTV